jgi:dTDP-4-amino-4,6-dideoxygalactose transaminase
MKIPITRPLFGPEELRAVQLPLESGWVVQGPFVQEFEEQFARYVGAGQTVAASSCTTALHLAVVALGLGPGDEVIVPAFTWISTANVVEYTGATPVFCDIDLETYNIDPLRIDELVGPRTVGIIPVHLFGLCADLDPILAAADRHSLWVLEDAACALGASYHGRHAGVFGTAGAFSFHPRKSITTGEGGMITTSDAGLAALTRSLRDHGASRSDHARHGQSDSFLLADYEHVGFNYRMTDIQAALGCAQLEKVDWILDRRRVIAAAYDEQLAGLEWLGTPNVPEGYVHGYQAYVCLFGGADASFEAVERLHERRNDLMRELEGSGIATRQGTHAPVLSEYYRRTYELEPEQFPNAVVADRLSLALPLFPQLTEGEQAFVTTALATTFASV